MPKTPREGRRLLSAEKRAQVLAALARLRDRGLLPATPTAVAREVGRPWCRRADGGPEGRRPYEALFALWCDGVVTRLRQGKVRSLYGLAEPPAPAAPRKKRNNPETGLARPE